MAGRLQRRLQKQLVDDLPKAAALGSDAEGSEEEEEEEEAASPPTKAFNPFAAFLTDEEVRRPTCRTATWVQAPQSAVAAAAL